MIVEIEGDAMIAEIGNVMIVEIEGDVTTVVIEGSVMIEIVGMIRNLVSIIVLVRDLVHHLMQIQ
jgi:hypothetical protein